MKYKYSLIEDIRNIIHTYRNIGFFNREKLFLIKWSLKNYIKLLYKYFTGQLPAPNLDKNSQRLYF